MTENKTRLAVVQAINNDEGSAVSEDALIERIETPSRKVKSALEGLEAAGVLQRSGLVGNSFWSIDRSASGEQIKQALQQRGASEIADQIIDDSSLLGEPGSAGRQDDIFEELL